MTHLLLRITLSAIIFTSRIRARNYDHDSSRVSFEKLSEKVLSELFILGFSYPDDIA